MRSIKFTGLPERDFERPQLLLKIEHRAVPDRVNLVEQVYATLPYVRPLPLQPVGGLGARAATWGSVQARCKSGCWEDRMCRSVQDRPLRIFGRSR